MMSQQNRRREGQSGRAAPLSEISQNLAVEEPSADAGVTSYSGLPGKDVRHSDDCQVTDQSQNWSDSSAAMQNHSNQPPTFIASGGTWTFQSFAQCPIPQPFGTGYFNSPYVSYSTYHFSQPSPYSFVPPQTYGQQVAPHTAPLQTPGNTSFVSQQSYGQQPVGTRSSLRAEAPVFPRSYEGPTLFRVYFLPENVPANSMVLKQKDQKGFFRHPVLVVDYDQGKDQAHFYSLTSNLPQGILDLHLYLKLGDSAEDTGQEVLRLGPGSRAMMQKTWVNLEQLFIIEWQYLQPWSRNVFVDIQERTKFSEKVARIEAQQNRFLYKPLYRDLSWIVPGTILMLKNNPDKSSTKGAPVVFLERERDWFLYLRIKEIGNLDYIGRKIEGTKNHLRLKIGRVGEINPGGAPVLYVDGPFQDMRVPSYVDGSAEPRWTKMWKFVTWTYPFMVIQAGSMDKMRQYLAQQNAPRHDNSPRGGGRRRGKG